MNILAKSKNQAKKAKQVVQSTHEVLSDPKEEFLKKYGIEVQMPANYIYQASFYSPDPRYIVSFNYQVFPNDITFYDYDKIGSEQPPEQNDFAQSQQLESNCISIKTYINLSGEYQPDKRRICDSQYLSNMTLSDDCTKLAIFRKEKIDFSHGFSFKDARCVIDIFDTSSIDFFIDQTPLTPDDPRLIMTIKDQELPKQNKVDLTIARFSRNNKCLSVLQNKQKVAIYNLDSADDKKILAKSEVVESLVKLYDCILSFSVNEDDITQSLIAAKKADFPTIDIFPIEFLTEANKIQISDIQGLNSRTQMADIQQQFTFSYIKVDNIDIDTSFLRFSRDNSQAIYCDSIQTISLRLATFDNPKQFQKAIMHLRDKVVRNITRYGEKEFLITTAKDQDKMVTLVHSDDPSKKIKFSFRFSKNCVDIRDVVCNGKDGNIEILISRDDEEFVVQKFSEFNSESRIFGQIFYETSQYIFEWPYICYLRGQDKVIIQNTFAPEKAVFVEIKGMHDNDFISHINMTEAYQLYVIIDCDDSYQIYEKDLSAVFTLFVPTTELRPGNVKVEKKQVMNSTLTTIVRKQKPCVTINKADIDNKQIFKFNIRGCLKSDGFELNQERVIFFSSNYQLYTVDEKDDEPKVVRIDGCHKLKHMDSNTYLYNPIDAKKRNTNEIKMITIGYADYQKSRVYEEMDGRIIEFLVQENQLLLLTKPLSEDNYLLKIIDLQGTKLGKLKSVLTIADSKLVGYLQIIENIRNNLLPAGNDLYTLIQSGETPKVICYPDVIPLQTQSGEKIQFNSPILNLHYRKMLYLIQNKMFKHPKKAIIIPFFNDNYIVFNRRDQAKQYCQFFQYQEGINIKTDILNFMPDSQIAQHYSVKGQLIEITKLKPFYKEYGDNVLALSQDGQIFLHNFDEDYDYKYLSIIQMKIKSPSIPVESQKTMLAKQFTSLNQEQMKNLKGEEFGSNSLKVKLLEEIETNLIPIEDPFYNSIKKNYLNEVIAYYRQNGCQIKVKINNKQDILIGFIYTNQTKAKNSREKYLKELFLLRKDGDKRVLLKIKIANEENEKVPIVPIEEESKRNLTAMLLQGDDEEDEEYEKFSQMNELNGCSQFLLTDEKVLIYSEIEIYHGVISLQNSNSKSITLEKSTFRIFDQKEAKITKISAVGQQEEDKIADNYHVYIKLIVDNSYAYFIKFNIDKGREYSSLQADTTAQIFYDKNYQGYVLDKSTIIDMDQGIPLYFYKTGMSDFNIDSLLGGSIDRGSRFSGKDSLFLIKNKVYLSYSYYIHILISNGIKYKIPFNEATFDPDAFYCLEGNTVLHTQVNNFKNMEFILNQYEALNPQLLNMLLLQNEQGENPLQIALKVKNSRSVNLILQKLSSLSMNNIHALKDNFPDLLEYNGFEGYLRLCLTQSTQMFNKTVFARDDEDDIDGITISPHQTCFLDGEFYDKFQNQENPAKPVEIRTIDASWILKQPAGAIFLQALSESEQISYFDLDTIKVLIRYQWKKVKPLIFKWLFIPFTINFLLFNFYCIYLFEASKVQPATSASADTSSLMYYSLQDVTGSNSTADASAEADLIYPSTTIMVLLWFTRVILFGFTFQTIYVEGRQMQFHKTAYFKSFWNILDITVVVLSPLIILFDTFDTTDQYDCAIRPMMAICLIIFYVRFFYFLRIFDATAPLVVTIVEITSDIKVFLGILMMGIVGFGAGFYILSNNNSFGGDQTKFITSFPQSFIYSYRMAVGDFGLDDFNTSENVILLWIFFICCSMFSAIILLNMLVAIMGESFNRVNEQADPQREREHLQLICENDFLFDRKKLYDDVKYLIEIKDDIDQDNKDVVRQQLDTFGRSMDYKHKKLYSEFFEMKTFMKYQNSQLAQLKKEMSSIKDLIIKTHHKE